MDTSIMALIKELEAENARLKKVYTEEKLKRILNEAKSNTKNELIANWLIWPMDNNRSWSFALCYFHLRHVKNLT